MILLYSSPEMTKLRADVRGAAGTPRLMCGAYP
jgi:hypothetical protein